MSLPGRSALAASIGISLLVLAVEPAAAQGMQPGQFELSLIGRAIGGGLVALVVCGGFVAMAPEYAEETTDYIRAEPLDTFLYGFAIGIAAVIVGFLLILTVVGILVAIPLFVALAVVGPLGYLAVGRAVSDDWGVALLVAVGVGALGAAIPVLGSIVQFVLTSMGTGVAYMHYSDGRPPGEQSNTRRRRERQGRGGASSQPKWREASRDDPESGTEERPEWIGDHLDDPGDDGNDDAGSPR